MDTVQSWKCLTTDPNFLVLVVKNLTPNVTIGSILYVPNTNGFLETVTNQEQQGSVTAIFTTLTYCDILNPPSIFVNTSKANCTEFYHCSLIYHALEGKIRHRIHLFTLMVFRAFQLELSFQEDQVMPF